MRIKSKELTLILNSVKNLLALTIIIAVFCLILPGTVEAAIAVDSVSTGPGTGATTITVSHTTAGTNRLMLVGITADLDVISVSSVTYNDSSLDLVGSEFNGSWLTTWIYKLVAPDIGTHNVVVTFAQSISDWEGHVGVITFTGVDQTTPLGTFVIKSAWSNPIFIDVSSASGELVFDTFIAYESPLTVGAGQTQRWNVVQGSTTRGASTEPGAATVTMSWTPEGGYVIGAVPIKPAAISPAPPNIPTLLRIFDNAIYNAWYEGVSTYECTLSVVATDPEGDDIQYEIQWDTEPLLGSPSSKTTSYYGSGVEAKTTIDLESIDPEQVYYWKARALIQTADWQYRKKITIDHTKVGVGVTPAPWYNTDWQYRNEITIDHTKVGVGISEAPWYNTDWQYRNEITIDHTKVSGEPWYNTDWQYCKNITVTAGSAAIPSGYTASVTFDHAALFSAGKSLVGGNDIRILHWNGSIWTELDRVLDPLSTWNDASTQTWFSLVDPIAASGSDSSYYLYYGNASASTPPDEWANVFMMGDDFDDGTLTSGVGTSTAGTASISETGGEAFIDLGTNEATDAGIIAMVDFLPSDNKFAIRHKTKLVSGGGTDNPEVKDIGIVQWPSQPGVEINTTENPRRRIIIHHRVDQQSKIIHFKPAPGTIAVDNYSSDSVTGGTIAADIEVDDVSSGSTIGTSITISHTTSGSDRLMLVGVSLNNDAYETVTGVTYNAVPLTFVGADARDDDARVEIWRLVAPATGTHNVVVTFSADLAEEGFAGVVTFTGVDQTTPLGTFASAFGDGTTATVDVSSATDELVFDVVAAEYSSSATVGAGQTQRWNILLSGSIGAGSTEPGAATVTMSWTLTGAGDHWAVGGVSIKPAPATSITISHTTSGSNRLMLVGVSINNDFYETVTGVTYNDSALTLVGTVSNSDDARVEIWRLIAPDIGTHDVVITFNTILNFRGLAGVMTFTGVDQTTPLGTFASAEADGITATVDVSSATDELVFGVVCSETSTNLTVGSGQTEYWNISVQGDRTLGAGSTEPGATTVTTSWTLGSSDHWAIAGVPIKPADIGQNYVWDGTAWVTGWGSWGDLSLDTYYIYELISDGTSWYIRVSDANGTELTTTSSVLWSNTFDTGTDPFWFYWGDVYTNYYYADVKSDWVYARKYVNPEPTSALGTEEQPLTNFPVLISRIDDDWRDTGNGGRVGQSDGGDILFTSSDGTTQLDHEIEIYVPSAGSLIAWVEVPTVSASTNTDIYIYYGNATVADQWNITETWDEGGSNNYEAVWHLNESSGNHLDATGNGNNSTTMQVTQQGADIGKIDGADDFDGTDDYVDFGNLLDFSTTPFTIEIWFKATTIDQLDQNTFMSKWHVTSGQREFRFEIDGETVNDSLVFYVQDIDESYYGLTGSPITSGNWYYTAVTVDWAGDDAYLYLNGSMDASEVNTWTNGMNYEISPVYIASRYGLNQFFDGIIDEVRISTTARSAYWIATCYNNQNSPNTFYSVGSIEERCLTDFPVLISRIDDDWRDTGNGGRVGQSDGGDILFTSSDGTTKLDHEIEKYVPSAGSLVAWVEVPTVPTYTDTSIYIYYGNATVADQWNTTGGTWDSDYEMVQHMADATSSTIEGSTSNSITGTKGSADNPDEVDGQIGMAQDFDGATEYMTFEDHTMWNWTPVDQNRTFSFWFYPTTNLPSADDAIQFLTGVSSFGNHYQFMAANDGTNTGFACVIWDNGWSYIGYYGVYWWPPSLDTWYYITFLASTDGNNEFYVNGVSQSLDMEWSWDDNTLINPSSIEVKSVAGPSYGRGRLDEYRFSHTARSATWIITSYNNQDSPSTFYSVGITEEQALTNFPVLINRTDTDWRDNVAQSDGGDILFTSSDGNTKLDHEIEEYDETTGELVAWVEIPTVSALTNTDIYIYYGNATVADQWNITETWDEGGDNNFKAVWHLNETTGGAGAIKDATSNNYDGTDNGPTLRTTGRMSKGFLFDGSNDYVDITIMNPQSYDDFTFSSWYKSTDAGVSDDEYIYNHHTDGSNEIMFGPTDDGAALDRLRLFMETTAQGGEAYYSTTDVVDQAWHYLVAVRTATGRIRIYVDGAEELDDPGTRFGTTTLTFDGDGPWIGDHPGNTEQVDGILDEVRVSFTGRAAGWIITCYNNQDSPSTFYSVDAEEECINSLWSGIRSFTMDMELGTSWPYWYQFAGSQFEQDTMNNVEVVGDAVKLVSPYTTGTLTSLPIVYDDLKTEDSNRDNWHGVKWTKSASDDDIKIQIEWLNGGSWELVPDGVITNNSTGLTCGAAFCSIDLSSMDETTYDTLRIKALFTKTAKSADDPALLMWALGKEGGVTGISPINKPLIFVLSRNKPNPFIGKTEIRYQIPKRVKVELQVFDVMGRSVVTLVKKEQKPGYYSIQWRGMDKNGRPLPSGVYFLRMEAGDFKATQKMVRLR